MRRVVITGYGFISPIGNHAEEVLENMKSGYCAVDSISRFEGQDREVSLACEIRSYREEEHFDKKTAKRLDKVNQFGIIAARRAYTHAGFEKGELSEKRAAVYVSSGIGGIETIEREYERGQERGFDKISPYFIPMAISNLTAALISIELDLHGACQCPVTACAGGTNAIGEAFRAIKHGYEDIAFAGGSEASITDLGIGGFTSMKALTTTKDKHRASIPFDKERSGFVMGEGAAVLVLEELEHALARNAKIYAEVVGYGMTCDAHHITSPSPDGKFAARAMRMAIEEAGIQPREVNYISAHGTSTPLNDKYETLAIKEVFGEHYKNVMVSSGKSQMGHLLSASGSMESILTLIGMEHGLVPATVNYAVADPECDLNLVVNQCREEQIEVAIKNSLGFGGHNAAVVYKRYRG
ncbi:MAG: beta-ketoacyl-ACP synthase II [Bacillota bacterium]|nr:beta-ketoacyl-ACP synthase II [Bacillota bacterium]